MKKKIYQFTKLVTLALLVMNGQYVFAQADSLADGTDDAGEIFSVIENGDTTRLKIGDAILFSIIETEKGVNITFEEKEVFSLIDTGNTIVISSNKENLASILKDENENIFMNEMILDNISEDISKVIEEAIIASVKNPNTIEIDVTEDSTTVNIEDKHNMEISETGGKKKLDLVHRNYILDENGDTTHIRLGNKEFEIIDEDEKKAFKWDSDQFEDGFWEDMEEDDKFKGHWAGFEWGINNYFNSNQKFEAPAGASYFTLNPTRSWNINFNITQYSLPFGDNLGMVTGLGFEFNNYYFDGNNSITKDGTGQITTLVPLQTVEKSKLSATYLMVPLLFEAQIPTSLGKGKVFASAGGIAGLRIGSHTKMVYYQFGKKQKDKVKDDFYLFPFKYGLTARIGVKAVKVYCNYYLSALFQNNKGPEVYPFDIGLIVASF